MGEGAGLAPKLKLSNLDHYRQTHRYMQLKTLPLRFLGGDGGVNNKVKIYIARYHQRPLARLIC